MTQLKQLQRKKTELERELKAEKEKALEINRRINRLKGLQLEVDKSISRLTIEPTVSEHALLRFIERTNVVDLKQIESQILSEELIKYIQQLGNGKFPIGNGLKAVVKDRVVVTVQ